MAQIKPTCKAENRDTPVENKGVDPKAGRKGWDEQGIGMDTHTLLILCVKQTTDGDLLYYTGSPTQYPAGS